MLRKSTHSGLCCEPEVDAFVAAKMASVIVIAKNYGKLNNPIFIDILMSALGENSLIWFIHILVFMLGKFLWLFEMSFCTFRTS